MKITAVKGKSAVFVISWGHAPFAVETTKRGTAYIPDGFIVEAKSDSNIWVGETRVTPKGTAEYRFTLRDYPEIRGEWRSNPTAAYKDANTRSGDLKFASGSNGRLIIGVTYENLQAEILKRFDEEIHKQQGTKPSSPDAVENIRPFPLMTEPAAPFQPKVEARRPGLAELCANLEIAAPPVKRTKLDEQAANDVAVEHILLSLRRGNVERSASFASSEFLAPQRQTQGVMT